MQIYNLIIEVTRRCNMKCCHCLRGGRENCDIKEEYIESLFKQVSYVSSLTISGGEPSLVPGKIEAILRLAKKHNVEIGNFWLATNGKKVTDKFLCALIKLYAYCSDNEVTGVKISRDNHHEDIPKDNINLLKALSFVNEQDYNDNDDTLLNEGEAYQNGIGGRVPVESEIDIDNEDIIEGDIYLNCKGEIILGCDWSYQNQPEHKICMVEDLTLTIEKMSVEAKQEA